MTATHFYVSAIDGPRRWILAGPYPTHEEALAMVRPVQEIAYREHPRSHFYAWGTAGSTEALKTPLGPMTIEDAQAA